MFQFFMWIQNFASKIKTFENLFSYGFCNKFVTDVYIFLLLKPSYGNKIFCVFSTIFSWMWSRSYVFHYREKRRLLIVCLRRRCWLFDCCWQKIGKLINNYINRGVNNQEALLNQTVHSLYLNIPEFYTVISAWYSIVLFNKSRFK